MSTLGDLPSSTPPLAAPAAGERRIGERPALAVALHDVEPATFARCRVIRAWLAERGVDRVTLLVIPAPALRPFYLGRPDIIGWLAERVEAGDEIAQHGLQHRQTRRAAAGRRTLARLQGAGAAEFAGLEPAEARAAVDAGWRALAVAGLEPRGFVAPGYAYTPALRAILAERFSWWAGLTGLHRRPRPRHGEAKPFQPAPALGLGASSRLKRELSPTFLRAAVRCSPPVVRLDLHPADLTRPDHVSALDAALNAFRGRTAVTYADLLAV